MKMKKMKYVRYTSELVIKLYHKYQDDTTTATVTTLCIVICIILHFEILNFIIQSSAHSVCDYIKQISILKISRHKAMNIACSFFIRLKLNTV